MMAAGCFPVADLFHTIQGEGSLAGVPSVFVRLAGCPVGCPWCDTKQAWSAEGFPRLTVERITERVASYKCRHVVVTGGEPLVHPRIGSLIDRFHDGGLHVTIETAGIVYRRLRCQLLSLSPKLDGEAPTFGNWFKPAVIRRLIAAAADYQLKFVVRSRRDVQQVLDAIERMEFIDRDRVMLMPRAATKAAYLRLAPAVAGWALAHGLRFCPRIHLTLGVR